MSAADELPEETPGYVKPKEVSLEDSLNLDKDDESLNKWKASLLSDTSGGKSDDPRLVVMEEFAVLPEGRDPIIFKLDSPEALAKIKSTPYILKEGATYKIRVKFRVQNDIVPALKFLNFTYKKMIRVNKEQHVIGSYGPQKESYEFTLPEDIVPSGMLARGSYTGKCKFVDDDGKIHCEWEYTFTIAKNWE